jgi:hypothetical protein
MNYVPGAVTMCAGMTVVGRRCAMLCYAVQELLVGLCAANVVTDGHLSIW